VLTLVHEVTGAVCRVEIGGRSVVKRAIRDELVGRAELTDEAVIITDVVDEVIVKVAARHLCCHAIIDRAVKRLIVIIHQPEVTRYAAF